LLMNVISIMVLIRFSFGCSKNMPSQSILFLLQYFHGDPNK